MQIKLIRPVLFGIVLLFVMMTTGICSADVVNVDFVSHLGGTISDVAIAGDYAYIGQGQDFVVLDISDKSNPIEAGKLTTSSLISYVAVSGKYAYVINENGLNVVNITKPSSPMITGSYSPSYYGVASSVTVSGDYVYLGVFNGFDILDITDPSSPREVGEYRYLTSPGTYGDVNVEGNYVYLNLNYYNGIADLQIVDITNPSSPTLEGSYTDYSDRDIHDVAVLGNYAYLLTGNKGLVILDIANLSSPTFVSSYDTGYYGAELDISVTENYAYIADGMNGLTIMDITNASSPKTIINFDTGYYADDVFLSGDYAYVIDDNNGLVIVNITNQSSPTLEGNYDTDYAADIVLSGNYAYVPQGSSLSIWNITVPSSPKIASRNDVFEDISDVAVSGNYAYVADRHRGLIIEDVQNPSMPTLVGSCDISGGAHSVDITDNYAYVTDGYTHLVVVDLATSSSPRIVGNCDLGYYGLEVGDVVGKYAYVFHRDMGLLIVDVTNPSSPTLVGSYNTAYNARYVNDVTVSNDYAYIAYYANGFCGLLVVNVTNPSSPILAGKFDDNYVANSVDVLGNYAYIASHQKGLTVVDITDPSLPTVAGIYDTAGISVGVAVSDDYVYVADGGNGLVILRPHLLEYELNKISRYTIYKYQISDAEIDDYVNQGYSLFEINQQLMEKTIDDKKGTLLNAFVDATEDEQQREEIQAIIDEYQSNSEEAVENVKEYVDTNVEDQSSWWDLVGKNYAASLSKSRIEGMKAGASWMKLYSELDDNTDLHIISSSSGMIISSYDAFQTEQEDEHDFAQSENYVSSETSNAVVATSRVLTIVGQLDATGYYSSLISETLGQFMKVATKMQEQRVLVPDNFKEEWRYVWDDVSTSGNVLLGTSDIYLGKDGQLGRIYENIFSEKKYVYVQGDPKQDWWSKIWGQRESGHWREVRQLYDDTWEMVPIYDSTSVVSKSLTYLTGVLIANAEPNYISQVTPMKVYGVYSRDLDVDGNAEVMGLDTIGNGEPNLFLYDFNKDGLFEMWNYVSTNNTNITGYDINADGKTEAYDLNGDDKTDAWDLDGDGKIDSIDSNSDDRVDAYDTNYDGSLDTFVEYDHEIVSWINSIPYGATYSEGENILFNGSVFNGTKKAVLPFDYTWNSDKDGLIGKGKTINLSNLSVGNHTISLTVKDSNNSSDVRSIPIIILPYIKNIPPVFEEIGNKTVIVNSHLSFTILATDSDGDKITYFATGMPTGAVLNGTTGVFSWTPSTIGSYDVTFTAVSNGLNDSENITITVSDWNPWNDPDSDGGESITLSELQDAIYDWRFGTALSTGETVDLSRLQDLIYCWRFGY